ncbi:MAG: DNA/RNA non-specific endonuclease [Pseudomonadota bacterium]
MPCYSFSTLYDRKTSRPAEYGSVTVLTEIICPGTFHQYERQVSVYGYVHPLETTSGRKSAPEPFSNFRIGATKRIPKKAKLISPRNTGRVDMDKGHIIALELGGPDVPANICPQWSQFQRNGEWRRMEVEIHGIAQDQENCDNLVMMNVHLFYSRSMSHTRGLCPSGFQVDLTLNDTGTLIKRYQIDNTHSAVDDKMLWRITDPLDAGGPEMMDLDPAPNGTRPPLSPSPSFPGAQSAITQRGNSMNWFEFMNRDFSDNDDTDDSDYMDTSD